MLYIIGRIYCDLV
jgi:hypothetical protein